MISSPLISIILPVYNSEDYIEQCICSISNQTYKNIEIIIINDGSTDESGNIADIHCSHDNRIRVIHTENRGVSNARNSGLDIMTGEYVVFVDSDDMIAENLVNDLYKELVMTDSDMVICGRTIFHNGKFLKRTHIKEYLPDLADNPMDIFDFLIANNGFGGVTCRILKKSIIDSCELRFDLQLSRNEDILFNLKYLLLCYRISNIRQYHYIQNKHDESATSNPEHEVLYRVNYVANKKREILIGENMYDDKYASLIILWELKSLGSAILLRYRMASHIEKRENVKHIIEINEHLRRIVFMHKPEAKALPLRKRFPLLLHLMLPGSAIGIIHSAFRVKSCFTH